MDKTPTRPPHRSVYRPDEFTELVAAQHGDTQTALDLLSKEAATYAEVPVSGYQVGVAALGLSGCVYLGANIELANGPLATTVHAEQAAVAIAKTHREPGLVSISLHAMPCGHCRQFLLELGPAESLTVLTPESIATLAELVPHPFGPVALGSDEFALSSDASDSASGASPDDVGLAIEAARRSHAPYTGALSGATITLQNGETVTGCRVESVAYNPTMDALRSALSSALFAGWPQSPVSRAMLAVSAAHEPRLRAEAEHVLNAISPEIPLAVVTFDPH